MQAEHPRKEKHKLKLTTIILLTLVALCGLLVLIRTYAFRLNQIVVYGLVEQSADEVIQDSRLVIGSNMLDIQAEDVSKALSNNDKVVFQEMQMDYATHRIYLFVTERNVKAVLYYLGVYYLIDDHCMVLGVADGDALPESVPLITGLSISGLTDGQIVSGVTTQQMEAYSILINVIKASDCIEKINLSDPEAILVDTSDGLTLMLADSTNLSAKMKAYRGIKPFIKQISEKGYLDLTNPEEAKFTAETKY